METAGAGRGVQRCAVFRDLVCFDQPDLRPVLGAVGLLDQLAIAIGQGLDTLADPAGEPCTAGLVALRHLLGMARVVRQPLVELRLVAVQHRDHPIEDVVDVDDDVGLEAAGPGEGVREMEDHRAGGQVRYIGADRRDGEQIRRVLHELTGGAVVRVIVVRPMRDDQVGAKRPD